ncbi:MAG: hypothetical protein KY393_00330 [Actinobacteria bacterium]|nr:hypothetical protein [Actinomycetota bacterium]
MCGEQTQLLRRPKSSSKVASGGHLSRAGWLLPLAAGIFLGAIVFDLLPAASASLGWYAAVWALAGLAAMALAGRRLQLAEGRRLAWLGAIGIWMHSLLEGMAAGAGYEAGATVGILMTVVLIMHLIPEASALSAFASQAKETGRLTAVRVAIALVLVAVGFITARLALPGLELSQLGPAMALAAGAFGYVAAITIRRSNSGLSTNLVGLLLGIVWMAALHIY